MGKLLPDQFARLALLSIELNEWRRLPIVPTS